MVFAFKYTSDCFVLNNCDGFVCVEVPFVPFGREVSKCVFFARAASVDLYLVVFNQQKTVKFANENNELVLVCQFDI